jgi:hypothetical protein
LLLFVFSVLHGGDELVAHGMPEPDAWVAYLASIPGRWLALHLVGLGMVPLLGLAVWWMLPPGRRASRVSQVALAAYLVLHPAFDALVGIGSSILIRYRATLPVADRLVLDPVIKDLFFDYSGTANALAAVASLAWGVGAIAAAVALWRDGAWRVGLPLAIAGAAMTVSHAAPFGTLAAVTLGVAIWQWLARERHPAAASTLQTAPT